MVLYILYGLYVILCTTLSIVIILYIRRGRELDKLSDSIHVTAHECYNVGWDHAMEVAREQYRIHGEVRNDR